MYQNNEMYEVMNMYCMLAFEKNKYIVARYIIIKLGNFEFNNLMYVHLKYILLRYYDLYIRNKTLIDLIFPIFINVPQIIKKYVF